eukprot:6055494-Pyramimonas_sp.AAC.1
MARRPTGGRFPEDLPKPLRSISEASFAFRRPAMGQLRICISEAPFHLRIGNPSQVPLAPLTCNNPSEAS